MTILKTALLGLALTTLEINAASAADKAQTTVDLGSFIGLRISCEQLIIAENGKGFQQLIREAEQKCRDKNAAFGLELSDDYRIRINEVLDNYPARRVNFEFAIKTVDKVGKLSDETETKK